MKTKIPVIIGILLVLTFCIPGVSAAADPFKINGAHYNLNIIGAKSYDETLGKEVGNSMGHTLFVKLNGHSKIMMTQGSEFQVTDRNGCDADGASFTIAPGYYNVFGTALGKPNGHVEITSYGNFTDALDGYQLLPLGTVSLDRTSGKPQRVNINDLFWVDVTLCTEAADDICIHNIQYTDYWVFDIPQLFEYYWDYFNTNTKLVQVRFYPCTIDPSGQASDYCRDENGRAYDPQQTLDVF